MISDVLLMWVSYLSKGICCASEMTCFEWFEISGCALTRAAFVWISFKREHNANFRAVVIADRKIRRIITAAYSIVIAFLLRERERVRRERVTRDPRRH